MKTFMLVIVLFTDGGAHQFIEDTGLTMEDCIAKMAYVKNSHCMTEGE